MPGIQNTTQAGQAIDVASRGNASLHRILTYLLERIEGFSSYTPFLGVGYLYDNDSIPLEDGLIPDIEHFSGEGISGADVGASTSSFRGFLIESGTYYVSLQWNGVTSPDAMIRYGTTAPTTDAALDSHGTLFYEDDTNFTGSHITGLLTVTADNYIWAVNAAGGSGQWEYASMVIYRLA